MGGFVAYRIETWAGNLHRILAAQMGQMQRVNFPTGIKTSNSNSKHTLQLE